MDAQEYNGWTCYATWRVALEFTDDLTSSMVGEQTFNSVYELAEYLKDEVDSFIEGTAYGVPATNTVLAGWARAFVGDVNWMEIAEASADELVVKELAEDD